MIAPAPCSWCGSRSARLRGIVKLAAARAAARLSRLDCPGVRVGRGRSRAAACDGDAAACMGPERRERYALWGDRVRLDVRVRCECMSDDVDDMERKMPSAAQRRRGLTLARRKKVAARRYLLDDWSNQARREPPLVSWRKYAS